jgi:hypothetical protein
MLGEITQRRAKIQIHPLPQLTVSRDAAVLMLGMAKENYIGIVGKLKVFLVQYFLLDLINF